MYMSDKSTGTLCVTLQHVSVSLVTRFGEEIVLDCRTEGRGNRIHKYFIFLFAAQKIFKMIFFKKKISFLPREKKDSPETSLTIHNCVSQIYYNDYNGKCCRNFGARLCFFTAYIRKTNCLYNIFACCFS